MRICRNGGQVSGIGGDNKHYTKSWSGYGEIETITYINNNKTFVHPLKNGERWPSREWGVSADSWTVTCFSPGKKISSTMVCENGGKITGIGGDNQRHSESWSGYGNISTIMYTHNNKVFVHPLKNGQRWPSHEWGVSASTLEVICD